MAFVESEKVPLVALAKPLVPLVAEVLIKKVLASKRPVIPPEKVPSVQLTVVLESKFMDCPLVALVEEIVQRLMLNLLPEFRPERSSDVPEMVS